MFKEDIQTDCILSTHLLALRAHTQAHMALVVLDWTHILEHETLGHLTSILLYTHRRSYHKWAVAWNYNSEIYYSFPSWFQLKEALTCTEDYEVFLAPVLAEGVLCFACQQDKLAASTTTHECMPSKMHAHSVAPEIWKVPCQIPFGHSYMDLQRWTAITCNGFSRTEEQIGHSSSSSTSPWNLLISIPILKD